jgi:hypothetical protein
MKEFLMNDSDAISFQAIVQQEGKFVFVAIPFAPRVVWGPKPRYHVSGSINGIVVRGTLGVLGQAYFLRLSGVWMRKSGIELGAHVIVQLSPTEDAHQGGTCA